MKLNNKKLTQSVIIILCIILRPIFMKIVGLEVNTISVNIFFRIVADIVVMAGMAQIIWVLLFYLLKLLRPSFLQE